MTNQFEGTAVKLSQGPLGIIALFIVSIHGFASLVLGLGADIGETNRSVFVWFLVLFPVVVLFVFAWLVSGSHEKLYPPGAFREEANFVSLVYGRARMDKPHMQKPSSKESATLLDTLKSGATGNLFWLGHDLMWTADVLLRKGPSEQVLIGLAQARHNLVQVGLGETPIDHEIRGLRELIQQRVELSPSLRDEYASQLGSIIDRIGMTAETAQADFKVPPHWSRVRS